MANRPIDWERVLRLRAKGLTLVEIGQRLAHGAESIGRGLRRRGVRSKTTSRWKHNRSRHATRLYGFWASLRKRCARSASAGSPRGRPRGALRKASAGAAPRAPAGSVRGASGGGDPSLRLASAWLDFDVFYEWAMAHGYKPGLLLLRVKRERGYVPANCRWVDRETFSARRPSTSKPPFLIHAFGESKGQLAWARDPRCKVKQPALRDRLVAGWPPEEAISTPPGGRPTRRVRPPGPLRRPRRRRARIPWDEVRRLVFEEGLSERDLAERYGATLDAILRGLRRIGLAPPTRSTPTPEMRRLHGVWTSMLKRSIDPLRRPRVTLADAWRDFDIFLAWAQESGARKGLWIARKNPRRGYAPDNCEWVSRQEATRRRLRHGT